MSDPHTLEEASKKGLQMEAWLIAEDKKHRVTKVRMAVEDEILRIIKNLQEKVEEPQRDHQEIRFLKCGIMGHKAQRCKQTLKKEDNNRGDVTCYSCWKKVRYSRGRNFGV